MFQNILKQAVQHTAGLEKASIANLGSAMKSMGIKGDAGNIFRGVGLQEGSLEASMHSALKQGAEKGMFYDEATMGGMLRNLQAGEKAMMGLNVGGMSGSSFLNNVAGQGGGLGQATAMVGLGAMAGTANMIAGGDFSEGAVVGALGGATVAGFARSMAKSGTALTDDVLKKAIGKENFKVEGSPGGTKLIPGATEVSEGSGTYMIKATDAEGKVITHGDRTKIVPTIEQLKALNIEDTSEGVVRPSSDAKSFYLSKQGGPKILNRDSVTMTGEMSSLDARKANLETFRNLNEDQLQRANLTVAQRDAMLETDPSKKTNIAMRNRMLTVGGGMLSGVAFTSNKRDYRRGFNKSRGNRI